MGCTYIRNCLVLIWNSNLTGNSVLLFAKSDNLTRRAVISRLGPLSGLQHEGVRGDRMEGPWWSRSKVLGGHLAGAPGIRGHAKDIKSSGLTLLACNYWDPERRFIGPQTEVQ